ncbi:Ca2+/H+ antiporter, cation antiporter, membrane protein [Volvox carteri f. nagariensis]|uniref:Vacuolar cation/proton exchanger n=1 Tax=Volvox carteri f. nagariensis TaxID=3068 RepID=D8U0M7_VOLCA|nr:Ca2+/H+ antiporter, cation antiporter, membrane protein [Volvox carteri f. nagariensis]EFJ46663.1 Ca2+/H+ antiporter, cation antiporter, membrane protein [Volvox carteri f. nagariensis]|eukprot:XP_002952192.1 Ca2+/H+ antiporter, cation antiporter, membrane protein [Volvox carteri f. nagariensis]
MIQARRTTDDPVADAARRTTYLRVVQLSLLGSVASNLLLVMGTAFIAGGLRTKAQLFNQTGINVNAGMLVLSCFAVMLPSLLDATQSGVSDNNRSELALSRFESIFMFLCYCAYLFFQLKTHRWRAGWGDDDGAGSDHDDDRSVSEGSEEELVLSRTGCFLWLAGVTVVISALSEFVTDSIRNASKSLHIPMPFLTTILLPIVGNAAEHASAIMFAYKNRIEIALGVAVGDSTQVSMMVVPFCVLLAWTMGLPLDLDFNGFESFVLFGCVLLAVLVIQDGHANYLKGILLLLTYFFVSAGFWWVRLRRAGVCDRSRRGCVCRTSGCSTRDSGWRCGKGRGTQEERYLLCMRDFTWL